MNLTDAVAILKRERPASLHEASAAATFVHSFYSFERPDLLRPADRAQAAVNDTAPGLKEARATILTPPEQRRMVTDAAPRPADRNAANKAFWRRLAPGRRTSDGLNPIAYTSGHIDEGEQGALTNRMPLVGAERVMKLEGSAAEYAITQSASDGTWLVRFPLARGQGMGGTAIGQQGGDHPTRTGTMDGVKLTQAMRAERDAESRRTGALAEMYRRAWGVAAS